MKVETLTFSDLLDFALVSEALGEAPAAGRISLLLHYEEVLCVSKERLIGALVASSEWLWTAKREKLASGPSVRTGQLRGCDVQS